jgi:hypothetical protein|tara:strand:+ start:295 stop:897 length:603 start_codon:yes stop_codon:yes gene_type:complete
MLFVATLFLLPPFSVIATTTNGTCLSFFTKKARGSMPLKWIVVAKWATEIVVRIADDCVSGDAHERIQECYEITGENGTMAMFKPLNKRNPQLVGLPPIPLKDLVKPKPTLGPKEKEKAVDRKLRDDLEFIQLQRKREKALRNRRKEIRVVIKRKRKEMQKKKEEDEQMRADHADEKKGKDIGGRFGGRLVVLYGWDRCD